MPCTGGVAQQAQPEQRYGHPEHHGDEQPVEPVVSMGRKPGSGVLPLIASSFHGAEGQAGHDMALAPSTCSAPHRWTALRQGFPASLRVTGCQRPPISSA